MGCYTVVIVHVLSIVINYSLCLDISQRESGPDEEETANRDREIQQILVEEIGGSILSPLSRRVFQILRIPRHSGFPEIMKQRYNDAALI